MSFNVDLLIVLFYFALIIGVGFSFKKMGTNSASDYFRGGGKMLWWMVGSTIFMTQFSAWTFTGAAGKAYTDGLTILGVFVGNILAFWVSYFYFAKKFRQTRLDTGSEIIRYRYGSKNEQFFTWLTIPVSLVSGGLWLNSLAIFVSLVIKIDIVTTIWIVGAVVVLVSLLSGAWGVAASDFVQLLVVSVISVMCAIVALVKVGGPVNLVTEFPNGFVMGKDMNFGVIVIATFLFFIIKQIQTNNSMLQSYRFLAARDSRSAAKGAILAMILMSVGTIIWFIPPWASAILYPDAGTYYSEFLGSKSAEGVYLLFAERAMPIGTVGLMVACLFSATMSSMDASLNRDTGILVKSFYKSILRPNATDKELLSVGYGVCFFIGLLVILTAQFYNSLKEISLFDLSMQIGTIVQAPMIVPLFFGVFIRKTPDWSGWATVLFGVLVSILISNIFTVNALADTFGAEFTKRELADLSIIWNIFCHLVFTGGFFWATTLFYKVPAPARQAQLNELYENFATEVVREDSLGQDESDRLQRLKIGRFTMISGFGILSLILVPNPLWGRLIMLVSALIVLAIGYLLHKSSLKKETAAQNTDNNIDDALLAE